MNDWLNPLASVSVCTSHVRDVRPEELGDAVIVAGYHTLPTDRTDDIQRDYMLIGGFVPSEK